MKLARWTRRELDALRSLHAAGVASEKISAEIGRSPAAVRGMSFRLGLCWTKKSAWAPDMPALRSLVDEGRTIAQIAASLGRSRSAVMVRMSRSGLRLSSRITDADVDAVAEAVESGEKMCTVARRLGMPRDRVEYISRRHALVSERSRSTGDTKPLDLRILPLAEAGMTAAAIGRQIGKPYWRVQNRLITLARRDAIADLRAG